MRDRYLYFVVYILLAISMFFVLASVYTSVEFYKVVDYDLSGSASTGTIQFTVEGPPSTEPEAPGPGGGGGGGPSVSRLRIDPSEIEITIVSGGKDSREIIVENIGNTYLAVAISVIGIENLVSFDRNEILLDSGDKSKLFLFISALGEGIFPGKVIFTASGVRKELIVLMNVVSENVLFDVSVFVPDEFKKIASGDTFSAEIELLQIGPKVGLDVTADYVIKNFEGKSFNQESETFFVRGERRYTKDFGELYLPVGDYVVGVGITYPGGFASSSAHFEVVDSLFFAPFSDDVFLALILAFLSLIIIIISILIYLKIRRDIKEG